MKRIAVLGAIVASGMVTVAVTAQGLPGITPIEHISGNVYKIFGAGGNTTVFLRADDVVLVDTKLAGNGEAILEQVRSITDKPVGMIVNTHSHPDHMGSNNDITANGNIQVVAQANSAARMGIASGPFPPSPVDMSFTSYARIGEGADEIEVYYFGRGHTDGDAWVSFPAAKAVVAGDIFAWTMAPLIDPSSGGSALAVPSTAGAAITSIPGTQYWIQGHGGVSTAGEFLDWVNFNRRLVEAAETTLHAGGTPEDALAAMEKDPQNAPYLDHKLKAGLEYGGTPWSRALINLRVAFQEMKGEEVQLMMGVPDPLQEGS